MLSVTGKSRKSQGNDRSRNMPLLARLTLSFGLNSRGDPTSGGGEVRFEREKEENSAIGERESRKDKVRAADARK